MAFKFVMSQPALAPLLCVASPPFGHRCHADRLPFDSVAVGLGIGGSVLFAGHYLKNNVSLL